MTTMYVLVSINNIETARYTLAEANLGHNIYTEAEHLTTKLEKKSRCPIKNAPSVT